MSAYFAFYNYINNVLDICFSVQDKWDWYQKTSEVGLIYPLDNVCVISDRPEQINMRNGRLHCESGPSIKYTDGFGVYSLNGVRMKKEYVMTPASEITHETVLSEQDVDMRRELIRKVGIQRLISWGKEVDCVGTYKLIDMSPILVGLRYAPYLLMLNPSVPDTWHIEGVSTDCKTVDQALHYRKPAAMKQIPVSEQGEHWYQQGDVCIWPEGALTLKPYPTVLT